MPNEFSPLSSLPNEDELKNLISNLQYKRLDVHELPTVIASNGLVSKFNSSIIAASGSTEGMLYSIVGIRPDKNDIDEHPFVFYYDHSDSSKNFGGIIHHGDWHERTVPMEPDQIAAMSASGLTASFTYKQIPPNSSGSLNELFNNGMISGYTKQFEILMKNKP